MVTKKRWGIPARLERTRQRFEHWRRGRRVGARIPERLWKSAVKMARIYGLHSAASTLGVDYYSLKKRVKEQEAASPGPAKPRQQQSVAAFLELAASPVGTTECMLELEKADGAKMRVHLKGTAAPDLAMLSRSFLEVDS